MLKVQVPSVMMEKVCMSGQRDIIPKFIWRVLEIACLC